MIISEVSVMRKNIIILALLLTPAFMSACAPKYACKGTLPGQICAPLSDVYAEEVMGEKASNEKEEKKVQGSEDRADFMSSDKTPSINHPALIVKSNVRVKQRSLLKDEDNKSTSGEKEIIKDITANEDMIPILRAPKIARIWIAPWVDGNGDLNMESFVYTEIEGKKWIMGDKTSDVSRESLEKSFNPLK
jgi:type IV conjugative transfer system lipoprotein TraV